MRQSDTNKFLIAGATVLVVTLAAQPALAQNALDQITNLYRDNTAAMGSSLRNYAVGLFALLATLEFAWSFTRLALRGGDFGDFVSEFVTRLMTILFFYWLMTSSGEIATAIVNSFREAGNTAAQAGGGSGGMRPSDIWNAGATMADRIMSTELGLQDIPKGIALMLAGIVMVVVFAILAALMIIALVESYLVMAAAVLLMGFGGSSWTKDIAVKTLTYCVSVGAKLFTVQIIVGLAEAMIRGWLDGLNGGAFAEDMRMVCEILGASVVMLALAFTVPSIVQSMINGSSMASANPVGAAAAAVAGGVAGGLAVAAGGGMAMSGAMKLASEQLKTADAAGTGPTTGLGRAGALVGGTMANLAKGTMNDAGQRLSGRVRAGNAPASIGASLHDQAGLMQKERMKPPAPEPVAAAAAAAAPEAGGTISPDGPGGPAGGGPAEGSDPIRGAAPTPEGKLASSAVDAAPTAASGAAPTVPGAGGASPAAGGAAASAGGAGKGSGSGSQAPGASPSQSASAGLAGEEAAERLSPASTISGASGGAGANLTDAAATAALDAATGTPGQGAAIASVASALGEAARADQTGQTGQTIQGAHGSAPGEASDGGSISAAPNSSVASAAIGDDGASMPSTGSTISGAAASDAGGGSSGRAQAAPVVAAPTASAPQTPFSGETMSATDALSSEGPPSTPSGTVQSAPPTAKTITAAPAKSEPVKTRRKGATLSERASGVRPTPKTPKGQ